MKKINGVRVERDDVYKDAIMILCEGKSMSITEFGNKLRQRPGWLYYNPYDIGRHYAHMLRKMGLADVYWSKIIPSGRITDAIDIS